MRVAIGLAIGNFVWQWLFGNHDWMEATKLSFFQWIAVAASLALALGARQED
jgi:hypothetical protein